MDKGDICWVQYPTGEGFRAIFQWVRGGTAGVISQDGQWHLVAAVFLTKEQSHEDQTA